MDHRIGSGQAAAASADDRATRAALETMAQGGNAVDAAIAANAVLAITCPHLCGLGGDLLAIVAQGPASSRPVRVLNASGRAAAGADPAALRARGLTAIPLRHDLAAVTVPGCVDGWVELHARYGHLALSEVLARATEYARDGFVTGRPLAGALGTLDERGTAALGEMTGQATGPDAVIRRPGAARVLDAVAREGRVGFYEGEFGEGLLAMAGHWFSPADLATIQATWVEPLTTRAFGHELITVPPNSQGYLALGAAAIAEQLDLPDDPSDPHWAHLLIEASTAVGYDRPELLHDGADGPALLTQVSARVDRVNPSRATQRPSPARLGDTTYLCTVDRDGMAVSLIQSNAAGFGSWIVEPRTGVPLHNRGLGFSVAPGHPAEIRPGARPPHTLSPLMVLGEDGMRLPLGTMGGDAQPQILLQVLTRILRHGQSPAEAVSAPRWVLRGPSTGFDTWTAPTPPSVVIEARQGDAWATDLRARGHEVIIAPNDGGEFGHAHAIRWHTDAPTQAGADHRTVIGSALIAPAA